MSLSAVLYTVAGQGERKVEGAQAPPSAGQWPEHLSARYREQMTLTQGALRSFGYTPGAIDGLMTFETPPRCAPSSESKASESRAGRIPRP